jgi:hypothetical protein
VIERFDVERGRGGRHALAIDQVGLVIDQVGLARPGSVETLGLITNVISTEPKQAPFFALRTWSRVPAKNRKNRYFTLGPRTPRTHVHPFFYCVIRYANGQL